MFWRAHLINRTISPGQVLWLVLCLVPGIGMSVDVADVDTRDLVAISLCEWNSRDKSRNIAHLGIAEFGSFAWGKCSWSQSWAFSFQPPWANGGDWDYAWCV